MTDTYRSLAFVHGGTTQHYSLYTAVKVTTWGFRGKKNLVGSPLHCVSRLYCACHAKFRISINMIRSMIRNPIRGP